MVPILDKTCGFGDILRERVKPLTRVRLPPIEVLHYSAVGFTDTLQIWFEVGISSILQQPHPCLRDRWVCRDGETVRDVLQPARMSTPRRHAIA